MCKGVKYNLQFKLPNNNYVVSNDLCMNDLIKTMKEHYNNYYGIDDIKISNQVVYNCIKRQNMCSKLIKKFCKIEQSSN